MSELQEPTIPVQILVGHVRFHAGVKVSIVQSAIDRQAARLSEAKLIASLPDMAKEIERLRCYLAHSGQTNKAMAEENDRLRARNAELVEAVRMSTARMEATAPALNGDIIHFNRAALAKETGAKT